MLFVFLVALLVQAASANVTAADKAAIIEVHDQWRCEKSIPSLRWNTKLQTVAQNYANKCIWGHNGQRTSESNAQGYGGYVGENLAKGTWSYYTTAALTELWMKEDKDWNCATNKCNTGKVCGHYTQGIWDKTLDIGCGIANCSGSRMLVCNYGPGGNYINQRPFPIGDCGKTNGSCPGQSSPTRAPTPPPTRRPTARPTSRPTQRPTPRPPVTVPTKRPTARPTRRPTPGPTPRPTPRPTTRRPTRSPTPPPVSGGALSDAVRNAILKEHNDVRCNLGIKKLGWDPILAKTAQNYADKCIWAHNSARTTEYKAFGGTEFTYVGENLATGSSGYYTEAALVALWNNEAADWNCGSNKCNTGKVCGHYTQNVWDQTTKIGCGVAICSGRRQLVCNYGKGGNYYGVRPFPGGQCGNTLGDCDGGNNNTPTETPTNPPTTPKPAGNPTGPNPTATDILEKFNAARCDIGLNALEWDNDLATVAQNFASTCQYRYNSGRNTEYRALTGDYTYIGETVGFWRSSVTSFEELAQQMLAEKQNFVCSTGACTSGSNCYRYRQIMWADTESVGCGWATCDQSGRTYYHLVCDFKKGGNFYGQKPFDVRACSKSGQECGSGNFLLDPPVLSEDVKWLPAEVLSRDTDNCEDFEGSIEGKGCATTGLPFQWTVKMKPDEAEWDTESLQELPDPLFTARFLRDDRKREEHNEPIFGVKVITRPLFSEGDVSTDVTDENLDVEGSEVGQVPNGYVLTMVFEDETPETRGTLEILADGGVVSSSDMVIRKGDLPIGVEAGEQGTEEEGRQEDSVVRVSTLIALSLTALIAFL